MSSFIRSAALMVIAAALEAAPPPLKYTALLGSGVISSVAVDAAGSVYVTGSATDNLPVTPGAFWASYAPAMCSYGIAQPLSGCPVAFAAKLTPDSTSLVYLTYLGISNGFGTAISVDSQGNAWISGQIGSSDLPVTPGAFQSTNRSPSSNARIYSSSFVLKLNASGSHVLYASYLGGSTPSDAQALDAAGNLYVAGTTGFTDFPVTAGAYQSAFGPAGNTAAAGFVTKFDSTGKVIYSTFFRGSGDSDTIIGGIAADAAGNAYFTGSQQGSTLPVTAGAFQTSTIAATAAFAAKLDPTGSKLVYCTYLAGSTSDNGSAVAVDQGGNAYIAGGFTSTYPPPPVSFPVTPGAFETTGGPHGRLRSRSLLLMLLIAIQAIAMQPAIAQTRGGAVTLRYAAISPVVALLAGILILIMPRLLNYIVAVYLILIGLIGLFG